MIILGIVIGIIFGIIIGACLAQVGKPTENENAEPTNAQVEKPTNTQVEKPTHEQIEQRQTMTHFINEDLKNKIMQMLEKRYATASEIAYRFDITVQKATALLVQLYREQKIQRLEFDGKTLWGIAN